jgi:hypothetical protein
LPDPPTALFDLVEPRHGGSDFVRVNTMLG